MTPYIYLATLLKGARPQSWEPLDLRLPVDFADNTLTQVFECKTFIYNRLF